MLSVKVTVSMLLFVTVTQFHMQRNSWGGTKQTLQQQALSLSIKISAEQAHLQILDETYLQYKIKLNILMRDMADTNRDLTAESHKIQISEYRLRQIAVNEYMNNATYSSGIIETMPADGMASLPLKNTYMGIADNLIQGYMTTMRIAKYRSGVDLKVLAKERSSALSASGKIKTARLRALSITNHLRREYASVQGRLAVMVTRDSQSQAANRAFRTAVGQSLEEMKPVPLPENAVLTVGNVSSGLKAVQAAESQLGVPYVWGDANPGIGFDCSGLVMWSWSQAGISLPHSAESQYMETTRIPLSDLQPGDLIFYADNGYVYHVVLYAGSGPYGKDTVIQAEETGTPISYTPIPPDPYAAGRP